MLLKAIEERWNSRYSGEVALLCKREALDPTKHYHALKQLHQSRSVEMHGKSLSREAIAREDLDDPVVADYAWRLRVKLALNRRGDAQRAALTKKRKQSGT